MTEFPAHLIPAPDIIEPQHASVIIAGAGPAGLFLALKLSQQGIDVLLLESEAQVLQSPRATTQVFTPQVGHHSGYLLSLTKSNRYMPIVLDQMEKVGLTDDILSAGHINSEGVVFRKSNAKGGEKLGALQMSAVPKGAVKYPFAGVHLGQHDVAEIILKHCEKQKCFQIKWRHRFVGCKQTETSKLVEVVAVGPFGEKFFTCDYLVGADGSASSVRRALCIPFEGFTWNDFRFVATNIKYDFEKYGFTTANMIVDDEDWAVITRTGPGDDPWRVAFGVRTNIPESGILKQIPEKFERILPGPRPLKYEVVNANPYWAHQRVAKTLKVGKVILTGDAAHVSISTQADIDR